MQQLPTDIAGPKIIKIKETLIFKILSGNKEKSQKSKKFFYKNRIILSRSTHRKARKGSREEEENTNRL